MTMLRHRSIAAAPVRGASEAWQVVVQLLVDTLEKSPSIGADTVREELAPLAGLGTALVAGGHLERTPLMLSDEALDVEIRVVTSDAALTVEENLNPLPGGASATTDWTLYLPAPTSLAEAARTAVEDCAHVTTEAPEDRKARSNVRATNLIDSEALRQLGSDR
jgi:hypothetical protein